MAKPRVQELKHVQLSHAHGMPNPENRIRFLNQLISLASKSDSNSAKKASEVRSVLLAKFPKTFESIVEAYGSQRFGLREIAHYLLRSPRCPVCGKRMNADWSLGKPYCSTTCYTRDVYDADTYASSVMVSTQRKATNVARYGCANTFQSPEIKKRVRRTLLRKYGVDNPSKSLAVKQRKVRTCQKNQGTDYPSQSAEVRAKASATTRLNYGVDNPAQSALVKARMLATLLIRHGVDNPSKSARLQRKKVLTSRRNWGVDNPSQHPEVQAKRGATNVARFGCHPMQTKPILEKSQRNAHRMKSTTLEGKVFEYQGYEDTGIRLLLEKFDPAEIVTQFDKDFPSWVMEESGTCPDLYLTPKNMFIEVKCTYTLFNQLSLNRKKASDLMATENQCRWLLVGKRKLGEYVWLPKRWYSLSTADLITFVESYFEIPESCKKLAKR